MRNDWSELLEDDSAIYMADGGTEEGCGYCGGHVSDSFERVFSDDDGELLACLECAPNASIAKAHRRRKYG